MVERPIATAHFSQLGALGITLGRAALWVVTLGATLPFFVAMIPALREDTQWRRGGLIGLVAVVLLTIATQLVATQIEPLRGAAILQAVRAHQAKPLERCFQFPRLKRERCGTESQHRWRETFDAPAISGSPFGAPRHLPRQLEG